MNEHDDAYVDAMLMVNMQANTRSVTTYARKSRPSALKRMRRRLGELQWWVAVRCARSEGERARESEEARMEWRREWRVRWPLHGRRGRSWRRRARMPATRRRWLDVLGRERHDHVRAREEGVDTGAGRPGWLRWLGRLVGAGRPVNSPLSHFF